MADEKERILKLLEEGRITADQAARLIEALGSRGEDSPAPPLRARLIRRRQLRGVERIPDIVAEAVSSAMGGQMRTGTRRQEFAGADRVRVKSVSGDVELEQAEADRVVVESSEPMTKVQEEGGEVAVRAVSGDMKLLVPENCQVELASVSGDVQVTGLCGGVTLRTVSGDVTLVRVSGRVDVNAASGDIAVMPAGQSEGVVRTVSGDVEVGLSADADLLIEARSAEPGGVALRLSLPHEVLEESEGCVKVKLGAGSRRLEVSTRSGSIEIGDAEEE
ncbi:MAG: DUF4097 family beta strand repeat-containing protein [candidate division WOR-3 bacterium]